MAHYKNHHIPFTSDLQMWSPSSSMTLDITNNTVTTADSRPYFYTTSATEESRYYHHEPIMQPAFCILCGLPHPYHHTIMKPTITTASCTATAAMITPAPLDNRLPVLSLERPQPNRRPLLKLQRPIMKRQMSRCLVSVMRKVCCKVLRLFSLVVKVPLARKYNVYPVKKHPYATGGKKDFHIN